MKLFQIQFNNLLHHDENFAFLRNHLILRSSFQFQLKFINKPNKINKNEQNKTNYSTNKQSIRTI